ncbi:hypothetical protein LPJ72_002081 [Coemansia sp. Benny D160-2]|nr:hypothetical protein LPJ72_002081 [Coemansia sp. Benny D160-2]
MATLEKLTRLSEPSIQGAHRAKEAIRKARQALDRSYDDYKQIYDMHPKLSIKDKLKQYLDEIESTVDERKQRADEFEREMAMVIELLKSREVAEKELHSQYLASASVTGGNIEAGSIEKQKNVKKKHTLYDHIDQDAVSSVEARTRECVGLLLQEATDETRELCRNALEQMDRIEIPAPEDISVTWAGVRDIGRLVEESRSAVADMEQDLASVERHCDQLRDTIRDLEADGESVLSMDDYNVLLRDTEEIPAIVEELHAILETVQQRAEEINVRFLQYTAFFDDNKRRFEVVTSVAEVASNFTQTAAESHRRLEDVVGEAEAALNDTWGLISWYRSFHSAYDSLIEEMQRRRMVQRLHQTEIEDMRARLEAMYMDEVRARAEFVDRAGPFLPSDLCPFIQDPPPYFSVDEAGDVARMPLLQSHETGYSKRASAMVVVEDSVPPS